MRNKGAKKFEKMIKQMNQNAKELEANPEVSFDELFSASFMNKYTNFSSFDDFMAASDLGVKTQEDFEALPKGDLDKYVSENSKFDNWDMMFKQAYGEYAFKKIGF